MRTVLLAIDDHPIASDGTVELEGERVDMPEVVDVLDTYAKVLKELSNPVEAERLQMEARRIRASMAYTVPVGNAK